MIRRREILAIPATRRGSFGGKSSAFQDKTVLSFHPFDKRKETSKKKEEQLMAVS